MKEVFNIDPKKNVMDKSKKMRSSNYSPKVLKCCSYPRVTLGEGAVTNGKKRQVLTVPPPSKPGYFTAKTEPPRVAKELGREPPRVKMAQGRALKQV